MNKFYIHIVKRLLDIIASLLALIIFSPVILIVILLLLITGHTKIFFVQQRVGRNEKIFQLVKFISMTDARDESGNLLPDDKRLTRFGSFLRKSSLDELPQLINVLKGDMSIIGPRPLLVQYLSLYNNEQKMRHLVKPGITGWAQVNGRNTISWTKKFEYDVWYVKNVSFILDCKIFFLSFWNTLLRKGISQEGHATAAPFRGNN